MIGDQLFDDQIIDRAGRLQAVSNSLYDLKHLNRNTVCDQLINSTLYMHKLGLYTTIFFCLSPISRRIHLDMIRLKFSIASHT